MTLASVKMPGEENFRNNTPANLLRYSLMEIKALTK